MAAEEQNYQVTSIREVEDYAYFSILKLDQSLNIMIKGKMISE